MPSVGLHPEGQLTVDDETFNGCCVFRSVKRSLILSMAALKDYPIALVSRGPYSSDEDGLRS